ncbi:dolichyl-phosphate-mannose-protein mannosyltransferase PMT1 [Ascoidea rubescens DSM 1968]|uniref:Dolichyl-phosphate-mannose--protein mannosyltransferase n=1 Tax=Ascoidea rubescens DSM 1968 TaxID=1344418 RepID=A0A1D2V8Z0_9ASCO|nr:glycosyltransferase family 39 protein [Ascoidea rubescens DSM 1968]ODV58029.1 glycosyltransferase family 39 protein [Ascoidea rubescens DSM 1968]
MAKKSSKKSSKLSSKRSNANFNSTSASKFIIKDGVSRPFVVTSPSEDLIRKRSVVNPKEKLLIAVLLFFTILIRFHALSKPNSVVFDEVHFGGFASKYINGKYFMDVHPPLAKMLFAAIGYIFGFKGDFPFKNIGDVYPETTPYLMMRAFPALLGVGTVLYCYLTLRATGCRVITSFFAAALLAIENSNVTISRYILLDSPLLFFIASSVYSIKKFEIQTPFSFEWFRSLVIAGVGLGFSVSSKWVGLFTIGWVGILMIWQLWFIIGDLNVSTKKIFFHFISRGFILLGIPLILYLFFFSIHFQLLPNEGDGSAFMSSAFRSTLSGNTIPKTTKAQVGVGSLVTIRHIATQGGYLHSHDHLYETGSKQQQITLYPHLDSNNHWLVELYNVTEVPTSFEQIKDRTKIRLKHKLTQRRLHSHDHKAPVSEQDYQKEVSAYGYAGFAGDANDDFIVEIVQQKSKPNARQEVRALETVFRLRHAMTGCYLFSHEVKLPKWGFEQQEVTCATQGVVPKSYWYIETNENEFLPKDAETVSYKKPSFLGKFIEHHKRAWHINNGLNSPHNWESRPHSWPFLTRGINYWVHNHTQVYLLGNAVIWWSASAAIFFFCCNLAANILNWQRGKPVCTDAHVFNWTIQMIHFIIGWGIHFFPSFLMTRQLFLHHYIPSLYFGILALAHFFDIFVSFVFANRRYVSYAILATFFGLSGLFFYNYSPLIYAEPWTKSLCQKSKLVSTWDFDCSAFYSDYITTSAESFDFKKAKPLVDENVIANDFKYKLDNN